MTDAEAAQVLSRRQRYVKALLDCDWQAVKANYQTMSDTPVYAEALTLAITAIEERIPLSAVEEAVRGWITTANQHLRAGVTEFGGKVDAAFFNPDKAWGFIKDNLTHQPEKGGTV